MTQISINEKNKKPAVLSMEPPADVHFAENQKFYKITSFDTNIYQ